MKNSLPVNAESPRRPLRHLLPALLWVAVFVVGAVLLTSRLLNRPREVDDLTPVTKLEQVKIPDGRVLVDVPWRHLPDVDRFKLTDQEGNSFDSVDLHGRPYVVSFFFATCPSFCRDLNNQLHSVNQALKNTDVQFVTVTVDPENDSVDVLKEYADGYDATPDRWAFLTGPKSELVRLGQHTFNVVVDRDTHTDSILLVDKWGRYRDRFKWSDANDMKRFVKVVQAVARETAPPMKQSVSTRNVMAGVDPPSLAAVAWLRDFHLTTVDGESWFSRDLTGNVWWATFYDPDSEDSRQAQRWIVEFAQQRPDLVPRGANILLNRDAVSRSDMKLVERPDWKTCVGGVPKVARIATEYFGVSIEQLKSQPQMFLVDRWGNVRLKIDAGDKAALVDAEALIKQLESELIPPAPR